MASAWSFLKGAAGYMEKQIDARDEEARMERKARLAAQLEGEMKAADRKYLEGEIKNYEYDWDAGKRYGINSRSQRVEAATRDITAAERVEQQRAEEADRLKIEGARLGLDKTRQDMRIDNERLALDRANTASQISERGRRSLDGSGGKSGTNGKMTMAMMGNEVMYQNSKMVADANAAGVPTHMIAEAATRSVAQAKSQGQSPDAAHRYFRLRIQSLQTQAKYNIESGKPGNSWATRPANAE